MSNEQLIRQLIRGSLMRAVQETVASLLVLAFFVNILRDTEVGSLSYYGCLMILVGTGVIVGVVWSFALSYRMLRSHPAHDVGFWREAFHAQAQLLRAVPYWYCAPLAVGGILLTAPSNAPELLPFLLVLLVFAIILGGVIWINRQVARDIEQAGTQLTD